MPEHVRMSNNQDLIIFKVILFDIPSKLFFVVLDSHSNLLIAFNPLGVQHFHSFNYLSS